jgi:hypothetical protein
VLCLGTYSGKFELTHAVFVRNRDEVTIPLDMELIPSAQDFAGNLFSL